MRDLTGQRFGRLKVIEFFEKRKSPNGVNKYFWKCKCDCGNTVNVNSQHLTTGHTKSCGCLYKETKSHVTHGLSKTRVYRVWRRMKERCTNGNCKDYKHYGGRGIILSEEWMSFEPFYDWAMSNGYQDDLTIDRIDVNGPYSPENCRWVTMKAQQSNRRNCVFLKMNGEIKTVTEWANIYGINCGTLRSRLATGMPLEIALTQKPKTRRTDHD